jgi:hypothetical protein
VTDDLIGVAFEDSCSGLKQQVRTARGPAHRLTFVEALVDDLVDRGLYEADGDPFVGAPPLAIVHDVTGRPSESWGVRRLGGTGVVPSVQRLRSLVRRCRSRQQFEPSTSCALPVATSASADAHPSGDEAAIARCFPSAPSIFGPVEGRALRVGVDHHNALSYPGPFASELQRERRLADAALLVEERHDHRGCLGVFHRSRRSPATEGLDSCRLESKLGGSEVVGLLEENGDSGY